MAIQSFLDYLATKNIFLQTNLAGDGLADLVYGSATNGDSSIITQNDFSVNYTAWLKTVVFGSDDFIDYVDSLDLAGEADILAKLNAGTFTVELNQNSATGAPYIKELQGLVDFDALFGDSAGTTLRTGRTTQDRFYVSDAAVPAGNEAPTASTIEDTATETQSTFDEDGTINNQDLPADSSLKTIDLLGTANDPDGDTLTASGFVFKDKDGNVIAQPSYVTIDGSNLKIEQNHPDLNHLGVGEELKISVTYTISDGLGGSVENTASLTITGTNDSPTATAIVETATETQSTFDADGTINNQDLLADSDLKIIDLVGTATDVDGDALTASGIQFFNKDGNPIGQPSYVTIDGNNLKIEQNHPNLNSLAAGQELKFSVSYTISDGHGGSVQNTANVTITGTNDSPTASAIVGTATEAQSTFEADGTINNQDLPEDSQLALVDLLGTANDVDGDTLTVDNIHFFDADDNEVTQPDYITFDGDRQLVIEQNHPGLNFLKAGEEIEFTIKYTISDGNGQEIDNTAVVTITGTNDSPTATTIVETATETESTYDSSHQITNQTLPGDSELKTIDLLSTANDVDGDSLSVSNIKFFDGEGNEITQPSYITIDGSNLKIEQNHPDLNALKDGEVLEISVGYTIGDDNGASIQNTVDLSITGTADQYQSVNNTGSTSQTYTALQSGTHTSAVQTITLDETGNASNKPGAIADSFVYHDGKIVGTTQDLANSPTENSSINDDATPDDFTVNITGLRDSTDPLETPLDVPGALDDKAIDYTIGFNNNVDVGDKVTVTAQYQYDYWYSE